MMGVNCEDVRLSEKPDTKDCVLYDCLISLCLEQAGPRKCISGWLPKAGVGEGMEGYG